MIEPDADAVLLAVETLAHCPTELTDGDPTDYKLKILVRQAQNYIKECGPMWRAWQNMMEDRKRV